jgi:hypothetical protein
MQTPVNLVASLLRNLILKEPVIPEELKTLYENHLRKETRPSLSDCSKLLQVVVGHFSKVFIVIDALDECTTTGGAKDDLLAEIQKLQPQTCLLVTSRDLPNIEHGLHGAYCLKLQASDTDIKNYIKEHISSSSDLMIFTKRDPKLYDDIITTIVTKSQGM